MKIRERILNIITNVLECEELIDNIPNLDLREDLGMDSINFVTLIVYIEDEFKIEIPIDKLEMKNFNTLENIEKIIEKLIKQGE